ncbi:hypothetical protein M427DRAFT_54607 [Gonapodya prolifera JEL478]|uniref:ABM domain-containing protein n=1 Tax=Gonapodya prolifera (strain JEL478) TaxID=1344416 RepID=A0A139AKK9_GONPJ|nr:hypothetical protein M427DRAFT_54607 [Gonapodya prolifera JEL478]|eukprot:KXS17306.1 hypothetical protein M427DRAFT_54607 [Gonapodya prolifera JEL478]
MTISTHYSAQIRVAALIPAKAGHEEMLIAALKDLVQVSNTQDGVLEYQLSQDTKNPTRFWMIESYRDKASLDAHMASDVFKNAGPLLGPLLDGEIKINVLTPVKFDNPTYPENQAPHTTGDIRIVAVLRAKPGHEEGLKVAITTPIEATHKEPGCLEYHYNIDTSNSSVFWMLETYTNMDTFHSHLATEHNAAGGKATGPHLTESPEINVCKVIRY